MPGWTWTVILLFVPLCIAGVTGALHHHHTHLLVEMGSLKMFAQAGLKL
jgi:hypothetical protein